MEPELERIVEEYLAARSARLALGEECNRLMAVAQDAQHGLLDADLRFRKARLALDEYGLRSEVSA